MASSARVHAGNQLRDMRRGSKELQAKYNTTNMIEILYAEATK